LAYQCHREKSWEQGFALAQSAAFFLGKGQEEYLPVLDARLRGHDNFSVALIYE